MHLGMFIPIYLKSWRRLGKHYHMEYSSIEDYDNEALKETKGEAKSKGV